MLRFIGLVILAYCAVVIFACTFQSRLLYLPHIPGRSIDATPDAIGLTYKEVRLETEDAVHLHAWHVPAPDPRATMIFFHGNAGNISHRLDSIRIFHELRLSVLILDYRGYGQSEGRPSERGTRRDARAAWRHLVDERGVPPGGIVLFGRSLGAAVAADLAREVEPGALMLESPFRTVPDLAQDLYPFLPARWLSRFQYAIEKYVRDIPAPKLIIHSEDDEIIPFRHGQAVFDAAAEPKRMLVLRGGHNTGFLVSESEYRHGIERFLADVAGLE